MKTKSRLSTTVDNERKRAPKQSAEAHRARILAVARVTFSQSGFDHTGIREVAAAAGVDPAVVVRVFGSKEALFEAVAAGAFELEEAFTGPADGLGNRVAKLLTGKNDEQREGAFDEFRFLLLSAASPVAGPILSRALHEGFIAPLAQHLGGREATARATLMTACILGFATLRVALGAKALETGRGGVAQRLGAALQACVTP